MDAGTKCDSNSAGTGRYWGTLLPNRQETRDSDAGSEICRGFEYGRKKSPTGLIYVQLPGGKDDPAFSQLWGSKGDLLLSINKRREEWEQKQKAEGVQLVYRIARGDTSPCWRNRYQVIGGFGPVLHRFGGRG